MNSITEPLRLATGSHQAGSGKVTAEAYSKMVCVG